MIEIRTFEGDAAEMADFVVPIWRRTYEGQMLIPVWTPETLEWNLLLERPDRTEHSILVAAYKGTKLVGLHPARFFPIQLRDRALLVTLGSWMTVDPEHRRQGIAKKMHTEFQRCHLERGALLNFGYLIKRSSAFLGTQFWTKRPKGSAPVCSLGMWMRALNHSEVAR